MWTNMTGNPTPPPDTTLKPTAASIAGLEQVPSPGLLFDLDAIDRNLARMIAMVGDRTDLLRPHIKTHKCAHILRRQAVAGIDRVKCATLAEAELAAREGVADILLAFPLAGPAVDRFIALTKQYPRSRLAATADDPDMARTLAAAAAAAGTAALPVFVDLDVGMGRTGIAPGPEAMALAGLIAATPPLRFAGLHAYDGHLHQPDLTERQNGFDEAATAVDGMVAALRAGGLEVPLVVAGGSPTFALHARRALAAGTGPRWECSPGTTVLWDVGYGDRYPDLPFEVAALLVTRVISRPGRGRLCLDLGHKAVAAERPLETRVRLPALEAGGGAVEPMSQSEEHLVLHVPDNRQWPPGTPLIAWPRHVCPTVALHEAAWLVRNGGVTGERWCIAARNRLGLAGGG